MTPYRSHPEFVNPRTPPITWSLQSDHPSVFLVSSGQLSVRLTEHPNWLSNVSISVGQLDPRDSPKQHVLPSDKPLRDTLYACWNLCGGHVDKLCGPTGKLAKLSFPHAILAMTVAAEIQLIELLVHGLCVLERAIADWDS